MRRARASSRLAPCATSLASIGSKSAVTFWPASSAFSKRSQGAEGTSSQPHHARLGQEVALGILGADRGTSMAWPFAPMSLCEEPKPEAGGDVELQPHEIEAGDHLRHGMLDLKARVHLQEEEPPVRAENELDRAEVLIARRLAKPHRRAADVVAQRGGPGWPPAPPR